MAKDDVLAVAESGVLASAGLDLTLRLVALLRGEAMARATAQHTEYPSRDYNRRLA
jgi:hypothetical protein